MASLKQKISGGFLKMNLAQFPRQRYTPTETPIEKLHHLSEVLGGPSIYLKRDDMLGLTVGEIKQGN